MIERLTSAELNRFRTTSRNPEYVEFLSALRVGEGGRIAVADTGVSRISVKNRVDQAAKIAGVQVKYLRSPQDVVVFQAVGKS